MQIFRITSIARVIGSTAVILANGSNGEIGEAKAADGANTVLAVGEVKASIYRRVEIQNGTIKVNDVNWRLTKTISECDPDALKNDPTCVFIVYEFE